VKVYYFNGFCRIRLGWNPETGNPEPGRLRELGLDWAI